MVGEGGVTYLGGVPVIEGVFCHEVPEGGDGRPPHVSHLTQRHLDLVEQQPHQKVVLTELIRQRVVVLQVCNVKHGLTSIVKRASDPSFHTDRMRTRKFHSTFAATHYDQSIKFRMNQSKSDIAFGKCE